MKVWDQAGIELVTPGSAVRHVSAVRQVTDCGYAVRQIFYPSYLNSFIQGKYYFLLVMFNFRRIYE